MTQNERSATGDIPTILIVGGGFSGAALAWHLHRIAPYKHNIVIVEPREEIGRGLAYDSRDPAHRINVPAVKMNLDADEEGHFDQWLVANGYPLRDPASQTSDALFPTREAFGDYVSTHIKELGPAVRHVRAKARTIVPHDGRYRVATDDGGEIAADIVVLAVCHAPPQVPSSLASLQHRPRFVANPWQAGALSSIASDHRVLIVGTGLTMADIVASLDRQGHRGPITAVSRRGLRSQPLAATHMEPFGDFIEKPEHTTLALLRHIRRDIAEAEKQGLTWHAALDQVRTQGTPIWRALPLHERAKLIRHLRPFWDTARFRIAPQVNDVIRRRIESGTLVIRAASVRASAIQSDDEFAVDLRPRRGRDWTRETFDTVVIATGPAHGTVFSTNSLLAQVGDAGLARPDSLGLGIETDLQGHAIGRDGAVSESLFVAGPLARGTFGELMGATELTRYARAIADIIAREHIGASRLPPRPVPA